MTMTLEQALEVAIEACEEEGKLYDEGHALGDALEQAAAVLRAFMEAHKAAEAFVEERQPQVLEALARLKALEDGLVRNVIIERPIGSVRQPLYADLAKEIAAIREKLGANASEPSPEPEP